MSLEGKICTFRVILVLLLVVPLHQGVTVKPVRCPTNKIAPHDKRSPYYGYGRNGGRTFGLLGPGGQQDQGLQERPQEDDPDDCGDIEDYDESDLSSLTQPFTQQGYSGANGNRFFGSWPWLNPGQPQTTTRAPTRPPTYMPLPAPPYWSGGYFSNNHYRPPVHHEPSDYVKPVHEGGYEREPPTYSPDIVGGPLGHVVGARPVRPSTRPPHHTTQRTTYTRFPPRTVGPTHHTTRPDRPRMFNNDGILGSFIDLLLFK